LCFQIICNSYSELVTFDLVFQNNVDYNAFIFCPNLGPPKETRANFFVQFGWRKIIFVWNHAHVHAQWYHGHMQQHHDCLRLYHVIYRVGHAGKSITHKVCILNKLIFFKRLHSPQDAPRLTKKLKKYIKLFF